MPNKSRGVGTAWLEGKSYIVVVCITGTSIAAGSTSKRFKGHTDQAARSIRIEQARSI